MCCLHTSDCLSIIASEVYIYKGNLIDFIDSVSHYWTGSRDHNAFFFFG